MRYNLLAPSLSLSLSLADARHRAAPSFSLSTHVAGHTWGFYAYRGERASLHMQRARKHLRKTRFLSISLPPSLLAKRIHLAGEHRPRGNLHVARVYIKLSN